MTTTQTTERLTASHVEPRQGPVYMTTDGDGLPMARCDYVVSAYVDGDDHEYTYGTSWRWATEAHAFAAVVREVSSINPELWDARVMYGTRTWADGGYEAAEIRREREDGYGD